MTESLKAIAAVDILPDGTTRPVTEPWPDAAPGPGALWRWLHCDRTGSGFAGWSKAMLPAHARNGLLQAETRPRCDGVGDGIVLTLRAINLNPGQAEEDMVSLRLWMTPGLVVSTRHRRVFVIEELLGEMRKGGAPLTPAAFSARLADRITARIESATAASEDAIDSIEEELLDSRPDAIGTGEVAIARIARSNIKLRRHIAPQREALSRFAVSEAGFLTAPERYDLHEIANRTMRAVEELDTVRDRVASLRAHIDSMHAARLGHNGFVLSVVAAIFLPLGFLTGLFGVNLAGIPGAHWPWAFAALAIGTAVLGVGLLLWFRWRKWF